MEVEGASVQQLQDQVFNNDLLLAHIISHVRSIRQKLRLRGVSRWFKSVIDKPVSWRSARCDVSVGTANQAQQIMLSVNGSLLKIDSAKGIGHLRQLLGDAEGQYRMEARALHIRFADSFYEKVQHNTELRTEVRTLLSLLANRATTMRMAIRVPLDAADGVLGAAFENNIEPVQQQLTRQMCAFDASLMCGPQLTRLHLIMGKHTHLYEMQHAVALTTFLVEFKGHRRNERLSDEVVAQVLHVVNDLPSVHSVVLSDVAMMSALVPKIKNNDRLQRLILLQTLREDTPAEIVPDFGGLNQDQQAQAVQQRQHDLQQMAMSLLPLNKFPRLHTLGVLTRTTPSDDLVLDVVNEMVSTRAKQAHRHSLHLIMRCANMNRIHKTVRKTQRFSHVKMKDRKHLLMKFENKLNVHLHHGKTFHELMKAGLLP